MGQENLDAQHLRKRGLRGYQGFFLALTLIVMIIIILTVKNLTTAILVIGLITNFLIISSQLTLLGDRHVASTSGDNGKGLARIDRALDTSVMVNPSPASILDGANLMESLAYPPAALSAEGMVRRPDARPPHPQSHLDTPPRGTREEMTSSPGKESFTMATTAPPGAGPPAFPNLPETSPAVGYPGAIDFGQTNLGDQALALGHVDWDASARDDVPVGNPYDLDRIASPQAAAPCIDDDAIAFYDGDELNTYQVRSRNDPERVWAGIYRRKALMDRYVREELDERENTQWWGAHEV